MSFVGEHESLSYKTAEELSRIILDVGEFGPGEKIPNENDLSMRFGVSRTTIREAIKTLAARRILEVKRGKGTYVAEVLPKKEYFSIAERDRMRIGLRDLFEVRLSIEPVMAGVACRRASDSEIEFIDELAKEVERALLAGEDITKADVAFHTAILQASHNDVIELMAQLLYQAQIDRRFRRANENVKHTVITDHMMIMEFLKMRDERGIESALRMHLIRLIEGLDL